MKSNIRKILILIILGVNFVLMINTNFLFSGNQKTMLSDPVKSEGYSISFIHIDGNWSATASTYDWCYGNGTWSTPYIIENVTIDASTSPIGDGIFINNSKNEYFIIKNCTVYNSGSGIIDAGIKLRNTNNGTIINNNCSNNGRDGIRIEFSDNNTILRNIVNDNYWVAIRLMAGYNNTVLGNTVNNNTFGVVINGEYNNILGNTINNNYGGIDFSTCNYNKATGNTLNNNEDRGIWVYKSHHNNITKNKASNNHRGMSIISSSLYNDITGNIFFNNTLGIFIKSDCWNNSLYENFFLKNGNHSIDDGPDNMWNSTTIGNYWDNHTTPDVNNDGIVDIPYNISGAVGSKDYLPIAEDGIPQIIINSPTEGEGFSSVAPNFDVTITEDYLDTMLYSLDGGVHNYTSTENGMINQSTWDEMDDGTITLIFYARDIPGYIGSAEVDIIKDTVAPIIIINSPAEGERFGKTVPLFNITVEELNIDVLWYSFDGGITTYAIINTTTFNQTAWTSLAKGNVTITFYVRDVAGNEATESVSIVKSVPSGLDSGVIITIVIVSIAGSIAVAYVIIKKRKASG